MEFTSLGECGQYDRGSIPISPEEAAALLSRYLQCDVCVGQDGLEIAVALPHKRPVCAYCQAMRVDRIGRCSCPLSGEWVLEPYKGRGDNCPIKFAR